MRRKKLIRRVSIIVICVLLLSIKIPFPTFILRASDIHCESISQIVEGGRSLWYYKPLSKDLIIKDSVRDIQFHVQEACAYNARFMYDPYIQFLLPWAEVKNFDDLYFFGIWFDQMNIRDKKAIGGIWFTVDSLSHNPVERSKQSWDDIKKGFSYYGVRLNAPLPDTLYFTVWGYPGLYVDTPTYRSLPENQRYEIIRKSDSLRKSTIVLGEITFVKSDSIISAKKQKEKERKLLIGNI